MTHLETILAAARTALAAVTDTVGLEQVKARYLGKSGELTELLKQLGKLPPEERKTAGAAINGLKTEVTALIEAKAADLAKSALDARLASERLDITLPVRPAPTAEATSKPLRQPHEKARRTWFSEINPTCSGIQNVLVGAVRKGANAYVGGGNRVLIWTSPTAEPQAFSNHPGML